MYLEPSYAGAFANVARDFGYDTSDDDVSKILAHVDNHIKEHTINKKIHTTSSKESELFWLEINKMIFMLSGIKNTNNEIEKLAHEMERRFNSGEISKAFDDSHSVLKKLKKHGYVIGIITNGTEGISNTIEKLGFCEHIDFCIISSVVGWEKPSREIFDIALKKAGVLPEETIHIGDDLITDIAGANNSGIEPILLDRSGIHKETNHCKHVINNLNDIMHIL